MYKNWAGSVHLMLVPNITLIASKYQGKDEMLMFCGDCVCCRQDTSRPHV